MKEMIPYIKYHDTDNRVFIELKKLAVKITGEENVEGETIADVLKVIATSLTGIEDIEGQTNAEILGFLASNYSGGSGGSFEPTILYGSDTLYHDEDKTNVVTYAEAPEIYEKGPVLVVSSGYYYYITNGGYKTDYSSGTPKSTYRFESGNMWFHSEAL